MRSVMRNLPWHTGRIILVSPPGHIPIWLNRNHERFQWVDQNDLVPVEDQPTFNSNAIEQKLHLIPDLSRWIAQILKSLR